MARLADCLDVATSTVSRVESGQRYPTQEIIRGWVKAVGRDKDLADRLVDKLNAARHLSQTAGVFLAGGHHDVSRQFTNRISACKQLFWFEADIIPGPMQTTLFAHAVISGVLEDAGSLVDDANRSALERSQQGGLLTARPDIQATFVVAEPALRWSYGCGRQAMVEQLHRVKALTELPNVTLRVVPLDDDLPRTMPPGFAMFDEREVLTEDPAGMRVVTGDAVSDYVRSAEQLVGVDMSVGGVDALELIDAAIGATWGDLLS